MQPEMRRDSVPTNEASFLRPVTAVLPPPNASAILITLVVTLSVAGRSAIALDVRDRQLPGSAEEIAET